MLKQKTAVILLAWVYFITLCHNIIPHHHHIISDLTLEIPCADNINDIPTEDDDHHHPFCHFQHTEEDVIFTFTSHLYDKISKLQLSFDCFIQDHISPGLALILFQRKAPNLQDGFCISNDLPASHLRGPPYSV